MCVRTPIAKGKGCLGWCVEMERGFGVFGDSRRWECWFIALFARGSVVEKRERRRWRGGAVLFALDSVGLR